MAAVSSSSAPAPRQDQPVPPSALRIVTSKLDNARVGIDYSKLIDAQGGKLPYVFAAKGLPDGLAIRNFSDRISGKPTAAGKYSVVVTVTDSADPPHSVSATLDLTVDPAH